jgi:hypothetical protein
MYRQTKQIETYKTTTNKQKSQHNPTKTTQQNNTQPKQTKQTNYSGPAKQTPRFGKNETWPFWLKVS